MVAVNGCCHGELDALYALVERMQKEENIKVDLVICCGDFESLRSTDDLRFFCAPPKYRKLKDFHKYFSGEKKAPVLTLVVGGNHEAPNVLKELYYGGWLAPNIFYLGHSGVVRIGGLRIAGLSGIYNSQHYQLGHFEKLPYDGNTARSAYHVRQFELMKLHCIEESVDIMLSHDWPEGIYNFGDKEVLLRSKPHFREDVQKKCLGNPATMALLKSMKPSFWFCGHLHVAFPALIAHSDGSFTRFMALDKVLPNRRCLQVVDIHPKTQEKYLKKPTPQTNIATSLTVEYDVEWLSILRANQLNIPTCHLRCESQVIAPSEQDREIVLKNLRRLAGRVNAGQKHAEAVSEAHAKPSPKTAAGDDDASSPAEETPEKEKEQKKHRSSAEIKEELFPWPSWTDPPFQLLQGQRRRLLEVIGMEEADVIFNNSKIDAPGLFPKADRSTSRQIPSSKTRKRKAPLVKVPEEEISLEVDDL
ncbi:hypothetical protein Esti_002245 [Eimeria stiedai]